MRINELQQIMGGFG
ncbi:MAG: bacteriocin [Prevotella sp.]|nr:bacteriocin [Prevotella sp.]